jgi:hypothetical protein
MMGHEYQKGQKIMVDHNVFAGSPDRGEHNVECEVLAPSPVHAPQVYVTRVDGNDSPLYVFKNRVTP